MLYSSDELTKMNWFSDLAGWVYDSKLKVTKTVTGSIQRAIETGFRAGTFTAAATKHGMGVQEFAAKVLRNKEDYSPSLVKKANFARNASKWH